ncbi:MAG TPA: type II toxin-antitoxin system VapC family toxin [Aeromicrobium sp.]|nr:type II toxin-antitoxin system VapC family toxin [Aeromicrobium sp.]
MRVYVDSSALLKRVFAESDSRPLISTLRDFQKADTALVTSSLAWVEISRAIRAYANTEIDVEVDNLVEVSLSGVLEKPITSEVIALARRLNPPVLRSLDAIHLATALLVDADVILAYDLRLIEAAAEHKIRTLSPTD